MRILLLSFLFFSANSHAQTNWKNIDSHYGELPSSFHVYESKDSVNGKPNIMYYAIASLNSPDLIFTSDTTLNRRLTPAQYLKKNDSALLVVNAGFFSFATNRNLNTVVLDGKLVAINEQSIREHGADSNKYFHSFFGTFGIMKNNRPDIAWTFSDSSAGILYAAQKPVPFIVSDRAAFTRKDLMKIHHARFKKWKVETAVGGGPVLVQNSEVRVTNNEERKFYGKAIYDRHPRTAIGYTKNNEIVIFVCEGRSDSAAGLTLPQMAKILKDIGCVEALNLDGGGSTCMLVNGLPVNTPSSKGIERAVPSVFMIKQK